MTRRDLREARLLVTGASSGIGRALAETLSAQGARLWLTARRETLLSQLAERLRAAGGEVEFLAGDLADAAHRERLLAALRAHWGALDGLINNAGIGGSDPFDEAPPERLREMFEVNFFAPAELIRASLPLLQAGRRPIVVNVGSVLGHCALAGKSEYCATKFALHGFTDALWAELRPCGIDVLLVTPSTTATDFSAKAHRGRATRRWRPLGAMSPETVAVRTAAAMRRGRREIILSWGGRGLVWLDRLFPGWAARLLSRWA